MKWLINPVTKQIATATPRAMPTRAVIAVPRNPVVAAVVAPGMGKI